jgi:DNA (cytosine-5)-methyltransferase 1
MLSTHSPLPTAVDLYSGSGAVTQGLVQGGFRVVAAIDNDAVACATYRLNHPEVRLYNRDIKRVSARQIRKSELCGEDVDLLVVCAPCQPFSSQNRAKTADSRVRLLLQSIRFASVLKPKLIFFENVPGLTARRHAALISKLRQGLARRGYQLGDPFKIDAADFGVPQRRLRCVMLASRSQLPAQGFLKTLVPVPRTTVRGAIGDLERLKSGERDPSDVLHKARAHQPIALKRLANIPKDGGSRSALPKRLELECHRGHKGHPDVYGRMAWDNVAPTLTTGCTDVTRGRFAHPEDDRAITLREAALLQTFPPSYQFTGNSSEIAIQIGNAVPVRLISALAPAFKSLIASVPNGRVPAPHTVPSAKMGSPE